MPIQFTYLADRKDAIPIVSKWYRDEWDHVVQDDSIERTRARIEDYLNRDEIPFILLATKDDEIIAAAQLKFHEMKEIFPDKKHWLGGVYVAAKHRSQGYGSQIVEQIAKIAPRYGVQTLHLQTEVLDGGLYARLGWTPCAQARNRGLKVLVMERHLQGRA
jgi:GNAT superfamily N-acetyltransferase